MNVILVICTCEEMCKVVFLLIFKCKSHLNSYGFTLKWHLNSALIKNLNSYIGFNRNQ